jgi:hypothetical protein
MKFDAQTKSQSGGPRNFIRLKDKESIVCVLRGEPYVFYQIWSNNKAQLVDPDDPNAQFRFRMNAILKENDQLVSKIIEQGWTVYSQLKDLHQEYDLSKTFIKITRNGSGTQTTYSIIPMNKNKPDEKQLSKVPLQELGHGKKGPQADDSGPNMEDRPSFVDDDEIPF